MSSPVFTAIALLCAAAALSSSSNSNANANSNTPSGGSPFPYHLLIRFQRLHSSPPEFCSGAIVAKNWVLTAAHCVYDDFMHPDNFTVYSGLSKFPGNAALHEKNNGFSVDEVITHFNHDPFHYRDLNWDYALLKTVSEFQKPDEVVPMVGRYFRPTGYAIATGFGLRDKSSSNQLQKSSIDAIASENCMAYHTYDQSKTNFCGGAFANCQQDFGSPLVRNGELIGVFIHSHSRNCKRKQPGVYADVSRVRDWIDEVISKFDTDGATIENIHSVDYSAEAFDNEAPPPSPNQNVRSVKGGVEGQTVYPINMVHVSDKDSFETD